MADRSAPPDAFGRTAEDYELGRPGWPEEIVERIPVARGAHVVDLAAGTGKLTRLLVARFRRVIAVEPDDEMRAVLERVVPGAESLRGSAEAMPLDDDAVDAVFCGEAFHWFASRQVADEVARVLRPRGTFAFLWNLDLELQPRWPDAAQRLLDPVFARSGAPGIHRVLSGEWREAFAGSDFGLLEEAEAWAEEEQSRDQTIARMLSVSSIAALPDAEREELREALRRIVPDVCYVARQRAKAYWTRLA